MIIYHQDNVAAFAGNHTYYWMTQPLLSQQISETSGVVEVTEGTRRQRQIASLVNARSRRRKC